MSRILMVAMAAILAAGQASAATYAGNGVDITNAAARIHVIPENRTDIAVEVAPGAHLQAPSVRVSAGHVVIDGGLNGRIHGCNSFQMFSAQPAVRVNIWGVGNVPLNELPQITLHVPRGLNLSANGAVFGDVGPSDGGRLNFHGCGADVNVAGSGDATLGPVNGPLRARLDGSGDITVASASGNLDLGVAGSGDLLVRGGNADQLLAALDGSGSINFRGHAKSVTADLGGSGDIDVASGGDTRAIHDHGSGEVHIGR